MSGTRFPETFTIGHKGTLLRQNPKDYDGDPRGIVWMYEPPVSNATYVMGIDPSLGRTGWNRYSRVDEDRKTNNGAIEILRLGRNHSPDVQACEFFAPVDAYEIGIIANILGRLYGGMDEDQQCKCILETYPGPGGMTYRQMTDLGYLNHWKWEYYADEVVTPSKSIGWTANRKTLRDLWVKCSRAISLHEALIRSPFLVNDFCDARFMPDLGYAISPQTSDGHGDKMRAFLLALWCAKGWGMDMERTREFITTSNEPVNYQATDLSIDEIQERWGSIMDNIGAW